MRRDGQKAMSDCFEFLGVAPQFVPEALSAKANKGINTSLFHYQVWRLRRAIKSLPGSIEKPMALVGWRIFDWLPTKKSYEPLAQDLRQELLGEFMPDIRHLESLLDRDLSIWHTSL